MASELSFEGQAFDKQCQEKGSPVAETTGAKMQRLKGSIWAGAGGAENRRKMDEMKETISSGRLKVQGSCPGSRGGVERKLEISHRKRPVLLHCPPLTCSASSIEGQHSLASYTNGLKEQFFSLSKLLLKRKPCHG